MQFLSSLRGLGLRTGVVDLYVRLQAGRGLGFDQGYTVKEKCD